MSPFGAMIGAIGLIIAVLWIAFIIWCMYSIAHSLNRIAKQLVVVNENLSSIDGAIMDLTEE